MHTLIAILFRLVLSSTQCSVQKIIKLTSVFETSSQTLNYSVCGDIGDGNGYSAGIIQFTTTSGSAQDVIDYYNQIDPQSEFSGLDTHSSVGLGSLPGFCQTWAKCSSDSRFQKAQLRQLVTLYFEPAFKLASTNGFTNWVSIGQIYDSCVQLGIEGTTALLGKLHAGNQPESDRIGMFIDARAAQLNHMGAVYAATITRINSYKYAISTLDLFGDDQAAQKALNNDGNQIDLFCDKNGWNIPGLEFIGDGFQPLTLNGGRRAIVSDIGLFLKLGITILIAGYLMGN